MAETTNLSLPLLAAAQAQKHVTVNEALVRLDGLSQLRLLSRTVTVPPAATDGAAYAVPLGAQGAWTGQEGTVAIWSNGGWVFTPPLAGWRAFIADEATPAMFDGTAWVAGAVAATASGAVSAFEAIEISHSVTAGTTSTTNALIPANTLVFGVTGRVTSAFTGTATSWQLGVSGSSNRYGSGLGTGAGSYAQGLTASPLAYYADTALVLTATSGLFDGGGAVTLVAHVFRMTPPA